MVPGGIEGLVWLFGRPRHAEGAGLLWLCEELSLVASPAAGGAAQGKAPCSQTSCWTGDCFFAISSLLARLPLWLSSEPGSL